MPTADLYPIPFATLIDRLDRELRRGEGLFLIPRKDWWRPEGGPDLGTAHFGRPLANPVGLASGPHTQLAQNIVMGWLCGARFFELKTVQVRDDLVIPRPCIYVPHVGYNVEWSQELRVRQSAEEYVTAWVLVHVLMGSGLWPAAQQATVFDTSLGYDLAGVRTDKVQGFLRTMRDASAEIEALRAQLPAHLQGTVIPSQVSDTLTLSTFHGCPAGEIEAIARETLDLGWNTVVKLNPTLLGHDRCRAMLDHMGYREVVLDPHAFAADLQWAQLQEMLPRLAAHARARGLGFGVKLSNTLVCRSPEAPFHAEAGGQGEVYLSGPPLHVLALTLAAELRAATAAHLPGLPITFSAGLDAENTSAVVAAGLGPVTTCSDLLKGRGYARLPKYLRNLSAAIERDGAPSLGAWVAAKGEGHIRGVASGLLDEPRYHRAAHQKAPAKVGSALDTFDCLTCDKCVPVCPNGANFTLPVSTGTFQPGTVRWSPDFLRQEGGEPLLVRKKHQIGNVADACNQCGECDTWCPEDGGPYLVKPHLFLSEQSFGEHAGRDGFLVDADRQGLRWRRGGVVYGYRLLADGSARLSTAEGALSLDLSERLLDAQGRGLVDLRVATSMRLLLAGFAHPDAEVWLVPVPAAPPAPASAAPAPLEPLLVEPV